MGVAERALKRLHPPGRAWWLPGNLGLLVEACAVALEAVRVFIRTAAAETVPWTADGMLEDWHLALGVRYDGTQTVGFQQRMLDAIQTAVGSSTLNALNEQMHKEMAGVDVTEVSAAAEAGVAECGVAECGADADSIAAFIYQIAGTVENDAEAARVQSVIEHFAPLHLQPYSVLVILSDSGVAECGVATVGIAECGST